jgi:hypothetical protein
MFLRCVGGKANEIRQLAEAFYTNDPYYPRPNPDDPLYKEFSTGCLSAHPKECRDAIDVGEGFLRAIEMSSTDIFPQIGFQYHSQVFTVPFVVSSPSLFPAQLYNPSF